MSEIIVKQVMYSHADKELLFQNISFRVPDGSKVALIGNNGSGKSTLLRMLAGDLQPVSGEIIVSEKPYYIPQHMGQFDSWTVAEALQVERKIEALHAILGGSVDVEFFTILGDDWDIEERSRSALEYWGLLNVKLGQKMSSLSGGEKTKVFLAGIQVHSPGVILLDEPTSNVDSINEGMILKSLAEQKSKKSIILVSHRESTMAIADRIYKVENGVMTEEA